MSEQKTNGTGERPEVIKLADRLSQVPIGGIIEHREVDDTLGFDYRNTNKRWLWIKASKLAIHLHGAYFNAIKGVGYQRLPAPEGLEVNGKKRFRRIRNTAKHGQVTELDLLRHANDLSGTEQRKSNQRMASWGLIEHLATAKSINSMPDEPPVKTDPLEPLKKALGI